MAQDGWIDATLRARKSGGSRVTGQDLEGVRLLKVVLAALAALLLAPSAFAKTPVVPSLQPQATHALWQAEVARAKRHPRVLADASCRPGRAIFYAQTDWMRLATKLAAQQSPCVQYFVSVPPLAADKTQARSGQASQIRALGANFHALDEISWNGWSSWVAAGNGSWFDAGVTARQRMATAGFDAAAGDTWALNELSSAVRTGTGAARANALEFMRGLSSDGVKGVAFAQGIAQTTSDTGVYKVNLQGFLQDTGFWSAVPGYVSDWAQEDYGDVRAYAVAGATPDQRRDAMVQYLGHELALANAGPDAVAAARAYLQASYVSFGNASWAWNSSYGFTNAPAATMQDFVSGQAYAMRTIGDRFGFSWAPNNAQALSSTDFNTQTASVLDRLAAAIRDASVDPASACGTWCATSVDGGAFTPVWSGFTTWSVPGLVLTAPAQSLTAGGTIQLTVQVQTAGVAQPVASDTPVTFTTTSPNGTFSPATAVIPAGQSTVTVSYTDTRAGTPTISAALPGQPAVAQAETVAAAPLASLAVTPATARVVIGSSARFAVTGADAYGNAVAPATTWSVSTTAYGSLASATAGSVTFVARKAGTTILRATSNGITASATVSTVRAATRVASVSTQTVGGHLVATARVTPAVRVPLTLIVRKGSSVVAVVRGMTSPAGVLRWRSKGRLPRARYVAKAALRTASTASRTQHSAM